MIQNANIGTPRPGRPAPLGAHWDGEGTNFALYSRSASAVTLCIYDQDMSRPSTEIPLKERNHDVWHVYVPGIHPGTRYGFRIDGEYSPKEGLRSNPAKLLLDPYAKALDGTITWDPSMFGYSQETGDDLAIDKSSNDRFIPKAVVTGSEFDWDGDHRPNTPWTDSIVYEVHVKGFSQLNPSIPEKLRGTWLGMGHQESINYLRDLGMTAVELLPVHAFTDDPFLEDLGLRNYWGYSTLNFFTPDPRYASSADPLVQIGEFRHMVKAMHQAEIEVILDVVFNHTCEGNHLGPTLSWKGIDNSTYYRLDPDNPRFYTDYTGTGNTLDLSNPQVIKMVLDSLRYWVEDMHVDGFRFDLAVALGREDPSFDASSGFFDAIHQDPVLSNVKLIAEPWDLGPRGYQTGAFPTFWSEWNDVFRDDVRSWWLQGDTDRGTLANRVAGSSDIFEPSGRGPRASVNFIVAHDGYTLRDLVSFEEKHNEANGEDNQDGHGHNQSINFGVEGPTDDAAINELRARTQRNMLATLLLSQGVPMISHGDEANRTQLGNNNAYAQDNELAWMHWDHDDSATSLFNFTQDLISLRKKEPLLRRRRYFRGQPDRPHTLKDVAWLRPDGSEMTHEDWISAANDPLIFRLSGSAFEETDDLGAEIRTSSLLIVMHPSSRALQITLPEPNGETGHTGWETILSTDSCAATRSPETVHAGATVCIPARTVVVFRGIVENEKHLEE